MNNFPIILIEVILVFGGVLAFGIWQLRALKKQMKPKDQKPDSSQSGDKSQNSGNSKA